MKGFNPEEVEIVHNGRVWELGEIVGRGGFSYVYLATSSGSEERLACKVIRHHWFFSLAFANNMLRAELECASKLHHENVVDILQTYSFPKYTLLLMPLYELGSLQRYLWSREANLDLTHVRCIFRQVTNALQYVHMKGVAHRDIKFENVLVKGRFSDTHPHFIVALCDFGLSKRVHGLTGSIAGTMYSMAPEVMGGEYYDPYKADVWSLGVLLYILLQKKHQYWKIRYNDIWNHRQTNWKELQVSSEVRHVLTTVLNICAVCRLSARDVWRLRWVQEPHPTIPDTQ
uniref:Protein kinase domain-containing protein n=1 Tax=Scylla olivacea TaxID=85551 RepID=A0A0P4WIN2_SCYOL